MRSKLTRAKVARPQNAEQPYRVLVERMSEGKMTVLYVASWDMLRKPFGPTMADFVKNNYTVIGS